MTAPDGIVDACGTEAPDGSAARAAIGRVSGKQRVDGESGMAAMAKRRQGPVAPPENEDIFLALETEDGVQYGRRLAAIAKPRANGLDVLSEPVETAIEGPVWLRLYDDANGGEAIIEQIEEGGLKAGAAIDKLFVVDD